MNQTAGGVLQSMGRKFGGISFLLSAHSFFCAKICVFGIHVKYHGM